MDNMAADRLCKVGSIDLATDRESGELIHTLVLE